MARPVDALVARMVNLSNVFRGSIVSQHSGAVTRLRWLGHTLACRYQSGFVPGQAVDWVVPHQYVILHQRVRPSRGERENPVSGLVDDFLLLGNSVSITMLVEERPDVALSLTVPTHVARRNRLRRGERISVSLLAEGIHLMIPGTDSSLDGPRESSPVWPSP